MTAGDQNRCIVFIFRRRHCLALSL